MRRFTFTRDFYIPKDSTEHKQEGIDAVVYSYPWGDGRAAVAFQGKANKPTWRYSFADKQRCDAYVQSYFAAVAQSQRAKSERKAQSQAGASAFGDTLKPGDYFYTSWGYDQTNYDHLIIISVSPTHKTVMCKMVDHIDYGPEGQQDVIGPGCAYGEPFRMTVRDGGLVGEYPFCKGSTRMGHFSKTDAFSTRRQTNFAFGH